MSHWNCPTRSYFFHFQNNGWVAVFLMHTWRRIACGFSNSLLPGYFILAVSWLMPSDQCGFQRDVRPPTWLVCSNAFSSVFVLTDVFSSVSLDYVYVSLSYSSLLFMIVWLSISFFTTSHVSLFLYMSVLIFVSSNSTNHPANCSAYALACTQVHRHSFHSTVQKDFISNICSCYFSVFGACSISLDHCILHACFVRKIIIKVNYNCGSGASLLCHKNSFVGSYWLGLTVSYDILATRNFLCVWLTMSQQSFGNIGAFNAAVEDRTSYEERFRLFLTANGITDDNKKQAIFLTTSSTETYLLFRSLAALKKPSDLLIADLLKIAAECYYPKPSLGVQRFRFNSRMLQAGESVATYLA